MSADMRYLLISLAWVIVLVAVAAVVVSGVLVIGVELRLTARRWRAQQRIRRVLRGSRR